MDKKARRDERRKIKELKSANKRRLDSCADEEEDDELESDFRLLKRLKKGKASMQEFDDNIQLDTVENDEDAV